MSAGASKAFARVYDENVERVYGYLAFRVYSRTQAEELTRLTFQRALQRWDEFDARRSSITEWLLAIAHGLIVDRSGAGDAPPAELAGGVAVTPGRSRHGSSTGVAPELAAALEQLDPRAHAVIGFRFGAALDEPEVARLTGLSIETVEQILSRTALRLTAELKRSSDRPGSPAPTPGASRPPTPEGRRSGAA